MTTRANCKECEWAYRVASQSVKKPRGRQAYSQADRARHRAAQVKHCPSCAELKAYAEFYADNRSTSGLSAWCKTCTNYEQKARKYGLSIDEVRELASAANCEACGREFTDVSEAFFDHDHETGQFRAILCHQCNSALGLMGEDPMKLRALADYAERWSHHRTQAASVASPDSSSSSSRWARSWSSSHSSAGSSEP
ncbi:endonuclease domain-containing protein [Nocardia aobensis]|uniref:Endonuclease domain-containing protein n=1 Tax=Nocardia aobensis TaxID=257277 RepID=A0ABW6P5X5_9NOCA